MIPAPSGRLTVAAPAPDPRTVAVKDASTSVGAAKALQQADCHDLDDARLESALASLPLAELQALREALQQLHRDEVTLCDRADALQSNWPDVASWWTLGGRIDDVKTTVLLGALSVAIAWQTHRAQSAPAGDIRRAIARIDAGVLYTLPIPRHEPCFCGSDSRYRDCHGRPPITDMIA